MGAVGSSISKSGAVGRLVGKQECLGVQAAAADFE